MKRKAALTDHDNAKVQRIESVAIGYNRQPYRCSRFHGTVRFDDFRPYVDLGLDRRGVPKPRLYYYRRPDTSMEHSFEDIDSVMDSLSTQSVWLKSDCHQPWMPTTPATSASSSSNYGT